MMKMDGRRIFANDGDEIEDDWGHWTCLISFYLTMSPFCNDRFFEYS